MEVRRFLRGRVDDDRLDQVITAVAERYDHEEPSVRYLDADNWLSTPLVLDEELFVKVISKQNSLVHALITTGRNIGVFSAGTEGFFEHFGTPYQMATHELEATERMRETGLNAPEPLEALEIAGLGVVVLEYLPEFRPLDELDREAARELAPDLFAALRTMHDHGLAHGDLRAENVLVLGDELYFIDATNIGSEGRADARAYDIACGLAALEPLVGATATVDAAATAYDTEDLIAALDFVDFVNIRPDHDCDAAALKGEVEKHAA
ncbi:RIO1 family regulatory kinase/ATPase [Haloplanus ruber]|uniref:non-specific serine/threonine protein kinase n=1 Tax=Haloplanus ruber TaxID=869892 RepID=A0ABD6D141_9EURY|nr:RIO1 family regulatory kinase/ATPase [Haloplanus ruber]